MRRQLAQSRPSGTSAVSLFSPSENKPYSVDFIVICNTTGATVDASVYHDADGTTYDETTALMFSQEISANGFLHMEVKIADYRKAGNLAVQTSSANALTFTAYGEIEGERL